MFITKRHMPRRTFLRGVGATIALPLLDAMVPAMAATPTAQSRYSFLHVPHGAAPGYWRPTGTGKSWDTFRFDDHECRQYAGSSVGTTPDGASTDSGLKSAVVGTAVGAAAGGLMGGNAGAGVGAGVGLAAGALAGSGAANASSRTAQQRYDHGYQQCMYAKGHKIPMSPQAAARERSQYRAASRPLRHPAPSRLLRRGRDRRNRPPLGADPRRRDRRRGGR